MGDGARGVAPAFQQTAAAESAADDGARATADGGDLGGRLAALYERGRAAHAGLAVTEAAFGRYLARAVAAAAARGPCPPLEQLAIEDFYLACACTAGAAGAAVAFEARFGKIIRRAVARVLASRDEREEAEQRVRQHLLVADAGAPPAIGKYLGHGALESWVSVVAVRVAISVGRAESSERRLRQKAITEATGIDPERLVIREEMRRELETAVKDALAALADRERLILRLFLVSGMTIGAIGRSLDVSRQAVSRSLAKAREGLLDDVSRSLKQRLKVSQEDRASHQSSRRQSPRRQHLAIAVAQLATAPPRRRRIVGPDRRRSARACARLPASAKGPTPRDGARATFDTADLATPLSALYQRGRAANPGLAVTEAAFGRAWRGRSRQRRGGVVGGA